MFCDKCGHKLSNESIFCDNCGNEADSNSPTNNINQEKSDNQGAPKKKIAAKLFYTSIVVIILVLSYTVYNLSSELENTQEALKSNQEKIENTESQLGTVSQRNENLQNVVEEEKKKREAAEDKLETTSANLKSKLTELEQESNTQDNNSLPNIVDKWGSIVVKITCEFRYSNTGNIYGISKGSGTLISSSNNDSTVITNKHVLIDDNGYGPYSCDVFIPSTYETHTVYTNAIGTSANVDFGVIDLNKNIQKIAVFNTCEKRPSIGDDVVVLGYPGIGSSYSITATEGIISGYEGSYYVTSAKIEQGNSGGAAILQKNNCFLGIPTLVAVGSVESLARILSIDAIKDAL